MDKIEGYKRFDTWVEVLTWVELGGEAYYKTPLDLLPKRVAVERRGQRVRVSPLVGTSFDSFLADEDHRMRFLREDQAPSSDMGPDPGETLTRVETPRRLRGAE